MNKLSLMLVVMGFAVVLNHSTVIAKPIFLLPANFFVLTTRAPPNKPANPDNRATVQIPDLITPKLQFLINVLQNSGKFGGGGGGGGSSSASGGGTGASFGAGFGFGFGIHKFQPTTARTTTHKPGSTTTEGSSEHSTDVHTDFEPETTQPYGPSTTTARPTPKTTQSSGGSTTRITTKRPTDESTTASTTTTTNGGYVYSTTTTRRPTTSRTTGYTTTTIDGYDYNNPRRFNAEQNNEIFN